RSDRDWSSDVCSSDLLGSCRPRWALLAGGADVLMSSGLAAKGYEKRICMCHLPEHNRPKTVQASTKASKAAHGLSCSSTPPKAEIGRASCRERGKVSV